MSRHLLAYALVVLVVARAELRADDPVKPDESKAAPATEAALAARQLLAVMDVILEHHIAPPTRQEMTLEALRTTYIMTARFPPQSLASQVSALKSRDEFQHFLEEAYAKFPLPRQADHPTVARMLIYGALKAARGNPQFMETKSALVEQQVKGNRYVGIGIALQKEESSGLTQVGTLLAGPGAKAGLQEKDLLVAIDGTPLQGKTIQEVVDLLRGPEGTRLTLEVRAPSDQVGDERSLKITRGLVPRKTIEGTSIEKPGVRTEPGVDAAARHRVNSKSTVAYVRLTQIGGSVAQELEQLEPQLAAAGFEGLILDLRSVASDDLHHAVLLIDAFLDRGLIGKVQTATGPKEFIADRDSLFRDWPIAVLVNNRTRGTAEWVAAALQDRQRARIIGFQTAGEVFVSSFVPIPGSEDSVRVATGLLERDKDAEAARRKRVRSVGRPFGALDVPTEGGAEEESSRQVWSVIADHVPEGLQQQYMMSKSLPFLRMRNTAKDDPQPPGAERLANDAPEHDPYIADALRTLEGQLRERKAAATN